MTTESQKADPPKVLREGSAKKRADILTAARALFLEDGFDRTTVDAISARAGVSKRTVYDYFGDKQTLLIGVLTEGGQVLLERIRDAIDDHLVNVTDAEAALTDFAVSISTMTTGSTDYLDLMKLLSRESAHLPEGGIDEWIADEPEVTLGENFAELSRVGLLDAPNPRLAADHFIALTIGMTRRSGNSPRLEGDEARQVIVDGVRAFLRAYGPR